MSRKALITAGAGGIGLAIALKAKAEGYDVTISDIDRQAGEALAAEHGLAFLPCDLSREAEILDLIRQVGRADLLVNNGGISGPTAPVAELSTEAWDLVFAVNVRAPFIACRQMVPLMKAAGGGTIVNISSVAAKIGYPNRAAYAASKRALLGFTASLAREVGHDGIRVNAVLPGAVRGPRIDGVIAEFARANGLTPAEAQARYLSRHANGQFVEADEIAALVLFLASDAARSITSEFISIDGGFE